MIVLKQRTSSVARWAFDGLHESRHAGEAPERPAFAVLEAAEQDRAQLLREEELVASQFAGDVLLDGRAEELAQRCASEAGGNIPLLKTVVPRVAERAGGPVDVLANYLAYRLAMEGQNWWGTATALQSGGGGAWAIARDVLLERADLSRLNDVDRSLLTQAISTEER